jgi:hypothetical protein
MTSEKEIIEQVQILFYVCIWRLKFYLIEKRLRKSNNFSGKCKVSRNEKVHPRLLSLNILIVLLFSNCIVKDKFLSLVFQNPCLGVHGIVYLGIISLSVNIFSRHRSWQSCSPYKAEHFCQLQCQLKISAARGKLSPNF